MDYNAKIRNFTGFVPTRMTRHLQTCRLYCYYEQRNTNSKQFIEKTIKSDKIIDSSGRTENFQLLLKRKKYLHTIVNQGMLACKAALHHN